jgi:hypothetical protein
VAGTAEGVAGVIGAQGDCAPAARLLGFAARLREEIGAEVPMHERRRYERQLEHARAALPDEAAFQSLWEEGRSLTQDEAIALADAAAFEG